MGKAAKLKELRRLARRTTKHLPEHNFKSSVVAQQDNRKTKTVFYDPYSDQGTQRLGECTRGAYKALKRGKVRRVEE